MDTSASSAPEPPTGPRRWPAAFSLVEVTLAIGIVAFAFTAIFGLVPVGLHNFRQTMNASISAQITQRVATDAQQSDFDALLTDASGTTITASSGCKTPRYFDEQGNELRNGQASQAFYSVNTRVAPATSLPGAQAAGANASLATVTVQVAINPSNAPLARGADNLWTGLRQGSSPGGGTVPMITETVYVARNGTNTAQ